MSDHFTRTRSLPCPTCDSAAGQPCTAPAMVGRGPVDWHHSERIVEAYSTEDKAVANGPQNFWDVREASTWQQRQAYTAHNVYIANTIVAAYKHPDDRIGEVTALIEERDQLLYTLGTGKTQAVGGTGQYLRGRIAGIEFALGLVGVKFA